MTEIEELRAVLKAQSSLIAQILRELSDPPPQGSGLIGESELATMWNHALDGLPRALRRPYFSGAPEFLLDP